MSNAREGRRHVLLHFHGGLVSESKGGRIGEALGDSFGSSGIQVVVIAWRSSVQEVIFDKLVRPVIESRLFEVVRALVERNTIRWRPRPGTHPGKGGSWPDPLRRHEINQALSSINVAWDWDTAAPVLDPTDWENYRQAIVAREGSFHFIQEDADAYGITPWLSSEKVIAEAATLPESELQQKLIQPAKGFATTFATRAALNISLDVLRRYVFRQWHGWHATIVEEVLREFRVGDAGTRAWAGMKRKADALFDSRESCGSSVLAAVLGAIEEDPAITFDTTGHSAGAVAQCAMMAAIANGSVEGPPIRNLISLAPACLSDDFDKRVLENVDDDTRLHLVTMSESFEERDWVMRPIYPRSLLYLVSGLFEDEIAAPVLGLARYLDLERRRGVKSLVRVGEVFAPEAGRTPARGHLVLTPTGSTLDASVFRSAATKHGAFDDDPETLRSIASLITGATEA